MQLSSSDLLTQGVAFGVRPALIVVDMTVGFASPESPLGGVFDSEITAAEALIQHFDGAGLPVYFSTVVYDNDSQQSVFRQHLPDLDMLARGSRWVEIDPRLSFSNNATLIEKTAPSAFFETQLNEKLKAGGVDSVVVCGLTTSGCVRATAVDALSCNFPVWVVEEACGDRNIDAHKANLHDLHAKYTEVVSLDTVSSYFAKKKAEDDHA
ncbi:isochorismatase family protein [Alteromonas sp. CI.11.F.A3]|uniref:isochorismatase family protein n=1 Tax=Alteromonas sp. CI.11.F.A3 TaxID=3079555 RepID=UPI002942D5F8|nr:isochorismatase family protein [Alteromonas sp. CI.11.F.A3]WOI38606.1 isochorismatase family protein [Alteromonas sp. CI.11.F.A3]